jgi:hypothetical protein
MSRTSIAPARPEEALAALQSWLSFLYREGLARYDDEQGAVRVGPEVSGQFAVGRIGQRPFLVFPGQEAAWSMLMPWEYAAVHRGRRDLYLVASPMMVGAGRGRTPAFGLGFELSNSTKTLAIAAAGTLDLRFHTARGNGQPTDRQGTSPLSIATVSSNAFASVPVRMLEDDEPAIGGVHQAYLDSRRRTRAKAA